MTDPTPRLTDQGIERALARRAPHGGDPMLVAAIVDAAVATPQRRPTWWSFGPAHGRRTALVWIGVAVALAIAVGAFLVAGGQRHDRPNLAIVVAPSPTAAPTAAPAPASPSAVPSTAPESPSPTSADACATDDMTILTGAAMPADDRDPVLPGVANVTGMFETQPSDGTTWTGPASIWSIRTGDAAAVRVASISGSRIDHVSVAGLTADGRTALLVVASVDSSGITCADVALVDTAGAGATVLSRFESVDAFPTAAISPDGRRVAYVGVAREAHQGHQVITIGVVGLAAATRSPVDQKVDCGSEDTSPTSVMWSPDGGHLAILCHDQVDVLDASKAKLIQSYHASPDQTFGALGWKDPSHVLLTSESGSVWPVRLLEGTVGRAATTVVDSWSMPERLRSGYGIDSTSPDLREQIVRRRFRPVAPGQTDPADAYLIDSKGRATQLPSGRHHRDTGWSADQHSIVYVDDVAGAASLERLDLASLGTTALGNLPTDYQGGIWLIP